MVGFVTPKAAANELNGSPPVSAPRLRNLIFVELLRSRHGYQSQKSQISQAVWHLPGAPVPLSPIIRQNLTDVNHHAKIPLRESHQKQRHGRGE